MRTLNQVEIVAVGGGKVQAPGTCARGMLTAGGFGVAFGGLIGGLIGTLGGPIGTAFGATLGASLMGGGAGALAAQGSACEPVITCTRDNPSGM